jgi:hypothetical protein
MTIVFFSSFKIRHLVAQTVDLVKMAPCEMADPGVTNYSPPPGYFEPENTLVVIECRLNENVTKFTLSTLSALLAAPIIVTLVKRSFAQ